MFSIVLRWICGGKYFANSFPNKTKTQTILFQPVRGFQPFLSHWLESILRSTAFYTTILNAKMARATWVLVVHFVVAYKIQSWFIELKFMQVVSWQVYQSPIASQFFFPMFCFMHLIWCSWCVVHAERTYFEGDFF